MERSLLIKSNKHLKNIVLAWIYMGILYLIFLKNPLNAQTILNQKIAVFESYKLSIPEALKKLSAETHIPFSYQSDLFYGQQFITLEKKNSYLKDILSDILPIFYQFKQEKDYIIIKPKDYISISGKIVDDSSDENLSNVHISIVGDTKSNKSQKNGSYNLSIPYDKKMNYLLCTKELYFDTLVPIYNLHKDYLIIRMRSMPVLEMYPVALCSLVSNKYEQKSNQPFSLHLIGGKSNGVNALEIGTLYNHNLSDGKGIQIAGIVNIIDKSMRGLQLAGLHNYVGDTSSGMQVSAILNKTEGLSKGIQVAAINHAHKLKGVQLGIINCNN